MYSSIEEALDAKEPVKEIFLRNVRAFDIQDLSAFAGLEFLGIQNSEFSNLKLPPELTSLKHLLIMNCSFDNIDTLPELEQLKIWDSCPQNLLCRIAEQRGLKTLSLIGNGLTQFPFEILKFNTLEKLSLDGNPIGSISPMIERLKNLKLASFAKCNLFEIPESIGQLLHLEVLGLSDNSLQVLPDSLSRLVQLQELDVSGNVLQSLSNNILELKCLRRLVLFGNNFKSLPKQLGDRVDLNIEARYPTFKLLDWHKKFDTIHVSEKFRQKILASPEQIDRLILDKRLANYKDSILKVARAAIGIEVETTTPNSPNASQIGNVSDLMALESEHRILVQINLSEMDCEFLPKQGRLIFYSSRVEFLEDEDAPLSWEGKSFKITFKKFPALPDIYHEVCFDDKTAEFAALLPLKKSGNYSAIVNKIGKSKTSRTGVFLNYINGYSWGLHESLFELACCKRGGRPEDWILLLSLGENLQYGIQEHLYYFIHITDLERRSFDKVFCCRALDEQLIR